MAANPFAARTDGDWSIAMPNDLARLKAFAKLVLD